MFEGVCRWLSERAALSVLAVCLVVLSAGSDPASARPPLETASAPGGKLVAATPSEVLRFRANGERDASFGGDGMVKLPVRRGWGFEPAGVAIDSRGRVLVAGTAGPAGVASIPGPSGYPDPPPTVAAVYRFLADGRRDTGFAANGAFVSQLGQQPPSDPNPLAGPSEGFEYQSPLVRLAGIAVDAGNRPLLLGSSVAQVVDCGFSRPFRYKTRTHVVRLDRNGNLDPGFGVGGVLTEDSLERPTGLALTAAGGILYANSTEMICARVGEGVPPVLSVLGADGLQQRFLAGPASGPGTELLTRALAVDRRGRILLLLDETRSDAPEVHSFSVRRLRPDGQLDPSFQGGTVPLGARGGALTDLTVGSRNRPLLTGWGPRRGGKRQLVVLRLRADGRVDPTFARKGRLSPG